MNGHFDMCGLIIENAQNKNPGDANGLTPLHFAALNCHLDLCELIILMIENKNPVCAWGETPKDMAKRRNFKEIVQLFDSYT